MATCGSLLSQLVAEKLIHTRFPLSTQAWVKVKNGALISTLVSIEKTHPKVKSGLLKVSTNHRVFVLIHHGV